MLLGKAPGGRRVVTIQTESSVFQPKFIVPRQRRETDRPLRPRCVYSMDSHPGRLPGVPQTDGTPSAFDAATAVRRAEGGGLVADLDPGWDVGGGVLNGGYLLAVAARAAVLDSPHPHPVALSASYLRATAAGPAHLAVTPGPAGRTLAHSTVLLAGEAGPSIAAQVTTATLGTEPAEYTVNPRHRCPTPRTASSPGPPAPGRPSAWSAGSTPGWTPRRRAGRSAGSPTSGCCGPGSG